MTVEFFVRSNKNNRLPNIGKGEVHSSILCGSTTNARFSEAFPAPDGRHLSQSCRTKHETRKSTGGKSVDSVRQAFTERRAVLSTLGLGLLIVTVLLYIMAARTFHHADGWRCHPGDRSTTNGRELCPAHGVGR